MLDSKFASFSSVCKYGNFMCFLAMLGMSTFAITTKILPSYPALNALLNSLLTYIYGATIRPSGRSFFKWNKRTIAAASLEVVDFTLRMTCVRFMPIGLAMTINAATPLYSAIVEYFLQPNRFSAEFQARRFACVLLIVTGLVIQSWNTVIMDTTSAGMHSILFGALLSLISSICRVFTNFVVQSDLEKEVSLHQWLNAAATVYLLLPVYAIVFDSTNVMQDVVLSFHMWWDGLIIAAVFLVSCIFMVKTFDHNDISVTTALAIRTLEIPLVFIFGIIFLGETSNIFSIVGCTLVTVCCLILVIFFSEEHVKTDEELIPLKPC